MVYLTMIGLKIQSYWEGNFPSIGKYKFPKYGPIVAGKKLIKKIILIYAFLSVH